MLGTYYICRGIETLKVKPGFTTETIPKRMSGLRSPNGESLEVIGVIRNVTKKFEDMMKRKTKRLGYLVKKDGINNTEHCIPESIDFFIDALHRYNGEQYD